MATPGESPSIINIKKKQEESHPVKKNNRVLRIGLLALVLTLVTASLVSGTFAKYVTTVNGTGTVQVAQWVAEIDGKTTAYTRACMNNHKYT